MSVKIIMEKRARPCNGIHSPQDASCPHCEFENNMKTKPLSPSDIDSNLENIIPEFVIQAVNNLLKKEYRNGQPVVLQQDEIIAEIRRVNAKTKRSTIFDQHWLDFESIFQKSGWKVEYDKPGYNESYPATFTFTPKRK